MITYKEWLLYNIKLVNFAVNYRNFVNSVSPISHVLKNKINFKICNYFYNYATKPKLKSEFVLSIIL